MARKRNDKKNGRSKWPPIKWKIYFVVSRETPKFVLLKKDVTNITISPDIRPEIYFQEEVLMILLQNRRMHCHEIYWHLRCNKVFSGILPEHKLKEMAKNLGKSLQSVKNKLRQLEEMGLVEKRKTCWMATSQDMAVAMSGRKRNRKLNAAGFFGNASRMTTLAYAALVSKGGNEVKGKAAKRKPEQGRYCYAIGRKIDRQGLWAF